MIDKKLLAEAARYNDAQSEELESLEAWAEVNNINLADLIYVAEQRAGRMAMIMEGRDPTKLPRTHFTAVMLSAQSRALMPTLTMVAMDGISHGIRAGRMENA